MKYSDIFKNLRIVWLHMFIIFCLVITVKSAKAQRSMKDSVLNFATMSPSIGLLIPGGDLAKRFGVFTAVGAKVSYKTKKNLIFSLSPQFHFGESVKEQSMLDFLKNADARILDRNGRFGDLIFEQRGFTVDFQVSKMIFQLGPNPNCGIYAGIGGGYLQHWIKIRELTNSFPAIEGEYSKGYDRMSSGPMLSQSLYYRFFANNRLLNFFVGFDFNQGFTHGRRSYQYDLKAPYLGARTDLSYGLRLGWTFPIYKRAPREFYYE